MILAGGAGTRLWPRSRQHRPKQFLNLLGAQSLLQQTLARLDGGLPCRPAYVICNEAHRFLAAEQVRQSGIQGTSLILESAVRNTAPAIALAALHATDQGDDPLMLVLPADHVVRDVEAFWQAVEQGTILAEQGRLVTFGVEPDRAETGYGYIERGAALATGWAVSRFIEKPDAVRAADYLASGRHCWNSG
ncbi:MAG TPA: mannose-1-phosphate guanylyltransferase, partial [Castellaniella sp.]|nr:mannose-1-phosphate guanylyltransferase [Castellaniella sp.]